jgi:hypothetical protein
MESTSMMKNKGKVVEEPIKEHRIWILLIQSVEWIRRSHLLEFVIPSIPGQRIYDVVTG